LKTQGEGRTILRWAGSKRRLVKRLANLLPRRWENYVEPMAGAAALFFHLGPRKALLGDINPELVNFYKVLRNDTSELISRLISLRASKTQYYVIRESTPTSELNRAIRFAYLNRLCWNGLYRVNQKGDFNVPMGDRLPRKLWDPEELNAAARQLRRAKLVNADFETTLGRLKAGDFAFVDPPYPRGAQTGFGFNRYATDFFSFEDHIRLGRIIEQLDRRGVLLMVLLSQSPDILRHYPLWFNRIPLRSKSLISSRSESRRMVSEIVMTNYVRS